MQGVRGGFKGSPFPVVTCLVHDWNVRQGVRGRFEGGFKGSPPPVSTYLVHGRNGGKGCRGGVGGGPPPVGSLARPPQAVQVCTLHHQPAGPPPTPLPTPIAILHSTKDKTSLHCVASKQEPPVPAPSALAMLHSVRSFDDVMECSKQEAAEREVGFVALRCSRKEYAQCQYHLHSQVPIKMW